jgi:hypothetical protein
MFVSEKVHQVLEGAYDQARQRFLANPKQHLGIGILSDCNDQDTHIFLMNLDDLEEYMEAIATFRSEQKRLQPQFVVWAGPDHFEECICPRKPRILAVAKQTGISIVEGMYEYYIDGFGVTFDNPVRFRDGRARHYFAN